MLRRELKAKGSDIKVLDRAITVAEIRKIAARNGLTAQLDRVAETAGREVSRVIRKNLGPFAAILVLIVIAFVVGGYILDNQRFRFPLAEETPMRINVELDTAQAVTPGPGPDRAGRRRARSATSAT